MDLFDEEIEEATEFIKHVDGKFDGHNPTYRSALYQPRRSTPPKSPFQIPFGDASSPGTSTFQLPPSLTTSKTKAEISPEPFSPISWSTSPDSGRISPGNVDDESELASPAYDAHEQMSFGMEIPKKSPSSRPIFISPPMALSYPMKSTVSERLDESHTLPPPNSLCSLSSSPTHATKVVLARRQRQRILRPPPRAQSARLSSSLCSEHGSYTQRAILTIDEDSTVQYSGCDFDDDLLASAKPPSNKTIERYWKVGDLCTAFETLRTELEAAPSTSPWSPQLRALVTGALDDDLIAMDFDAKNMNLDDECSKVTMEFVKHLLPVSELRLLESSMPGNETAAKQETKQRKQSQSEASTEDPFGGLDANLLMAKLQDLIV